MILFDFQSVRIAGLLIISSLVAVGTGHAQDSIRPVIAYEKDPLNERGGVGIFKWSPDSRRIAYVKFQSGEVGIVDVETAAVVAISNFKMNAIATLAWSPDGGSLAVSSSQELKIVRLSDFQVTHDVSVQAGLSGRVRFGKEAAFSRDGTRLLLENANNHEHIILYSYDLVRNVVEPHIRSPFGTKNTMPRANTGKFQEHNGHLYFSVAIARVDEAIKQEEVIDRVDYGRALIPTTCFAFDLGDGRRVPIVRSVDFPPPGQEKADGSKDITDCRYSAATDYFVVRRRYPLKLDGEQPPFPKSQGNFFEAVALDGSRSDVFPRGESPERRAFFMAYGLHPVQPWAVTIANSDRQPGLLTVWDYMTGEALTRIQTANAHAFFEISPNGERAAFSVMSGEGLRTYRFRKP